MRRREAEQGRLAAELLLLEARIKLDAVSSERDQLQAALKRGLRFYLGRTVVVHQNGPSLRGVLAAVNKDCLVLRQATHLDADTDLGGEVVVPRAQGVYVQIPDSEAA